MLLVRTTKELCEGADPAPIVEDHYYLTSLSPADKRYSPSVLLSLVREHWGIENRLHHVKDRTLNEDSQRHQKGAATAARFRSLAVGLFHHVEGLTIPAKRILLQAHPRIALRLLKLRRRPKQPIRL